MRTLLSNIFVFGTACICMVFLGPMAAAVLSTDSGTDCMTRWNESYRAQAQAIASGDFSKAADEAAACERMLVTALADSKHKEQPSLKDGVLECREIVGLHSLSETRRTQAKSGFELLIKADSLFEDKQYGESVALSYLSLEPIEKAFGAESALLQRVRFSMLKNCNSLGMNARVIELASQSLKYYRKSSEFDGVRMSEMLTLQAWAHMGEGDFTNADKRLREALIISRQTDGHRRQLLIALIMLARLNIELDRFEEADALLVQVVQDDDVALLRLDERILALVCRAQVQRRIGQLEDAKAMLTGAEEILVKNDPGPTTLAITLYEELAKVKKGANKDVEAEVALRKARDLKAARDKIVEHFLARIRTATPGNP